MKLLIVNFHYFGEEDEYRAGIFPISAKRFSNQLDLLARHFSFIGQKELLDAIEGKRLLPENSCLITMDDGLRCQYEIALTILKEKKVPAIFFVGSLPYLEKEVCLVHKIHYLFANYSSNVMFNFINNFMKTNTPSESLSDIIDKIKFDAQKKYRYDEPITASIKMLFNTDKIFNLEMRKKLISELFSVLVKNEKEFVEKLYMNENQLRDLFNNNMLGLHSHSHQSLAYLSNLQIEKDLNINKEAIEKIVSGKILSISFPYGGKMDVNSDVLAVCQKIGFKLGFTMERALNSTLINSLMLARLDTNDVLGGKNPMFEFDGNNLNILHGMTMQRKLFFKE